MSKTVLLFLLSVTVTSCSDHNAGGDMGPSPDSTPAGTGRVKALRLTGQVSGWTEQAGSYVFFDAASLFKLINGGAQPHVDRGLVEGIYQVMRSAGRQVDLFAEDFGSAANAQKMYAFEKGQVVAPLTLSTYGSDIATGYAVLGGAVFHSVFHSFYFKLSFTGYTAAEQKSLLTDVEAFMAAYEALSKVPAGG